MTLTLPATLTAIGIVSLIVAGTLEQSWLAAMMVGLLAVRAASLRPVLRAAILISVFCMPLFLIHGLFNGQYAKDAELFGVDVRTAGFAFAHQISARIAVFVAIAVAWYELPGDYVIDAFARLRLPTVATVILAQGISIIHQIPRLAVSILLAQQSRGLKTGPGVLARLKALPAVILPLVSKLLIDAEPRAVALSSRGFASGPMSTPPVRLASAADVVFGAAAAAGAVAIRAAMP